MKSSSLILSGNEINSWDMIRLRLCGFPYHFAVMSFIARNRILNSESLVGEHRPCLGDLPQLPVESLDGIGGVDELLALGEERQNILWPITVNLHCTIKNLTVLAT